MRTRAIQDLAKLPEKEFFDEISEGLSLVADNAIRINSDAQALFNNKQMRGARVLTVFAEEEAAKFLILLDAVRCPRTPQIRLCKHLGKYYSHLAKGLYAECCNWRPATFAELKDGIMRESHDYYLDGPNDIDWIFKNNIIQSREDTLYVNYAENDGTHYWQSPGQFDTMFNFYSLPASVVLVTTLHNVGCTKPESLKVIADRWFDVPITDDLTWRTVQDTNIAILEEMESCLILNDQPSSEYSCVANKWPFPLYDLELKEIKVDKAQLEQVRREWSPDW